MSHIAVRCLEGPHAGKTIAIDGGHPMQLDIKRGGEPAGRLSFAVSSHGIEFLNSSPVESLVNGVSMRRAQLANGDMVQIGKMKFQAAVNGATSTGSMVNDKDETVPSLPLLGDPADDDDAMDTDVDDSGDQDILGDHDLGVTDQGKQVTAVYTRSSPEPDGQVPAGGSRSSRRISASKMAAVDIPAPERAGLFGKVGKVFKRKEEKDAELLELERQRDELLCLAGRRALQHVGGMGLPPDLLYRLGMGQSVTLSPADIAQGARETFRRHAELLVYLDAEIAARREALELGPDPAVLAARQLQLQTEHDEHKEGAFRAMDQMMTDEVLASTTTLNSVVEDESDELSPLSSAAGSSDQLSASGRRRARRRRR